MNIRFVAFFFQMDTHFRLIRHLRFFLAERMYTVLHHAHQRFPQLHGIDLRDELLAKRLEYYTDIVRLNLFLVILFQYLQVVED